MGRKSLFDLKDSIKVFNLSEIEQSYEEFKRNHESFINDILDKMNEKEIDSMGQDKIYQTFFNKAVNDSKNMELFNRFSKWAQDVSVFKERLLKLNFLYKDESTGETKDYNDCYFFESIGNSSECNEEYEKLSKSIEDKETPDNFEYNIIYFGGVLSESDKSVDDNCLLWLKRISRENELSGEILNNQVTKEQSA